MPDIPRTTITKAWRHLAKREPFHAGNLWATRTPFGFGELEGEARRQFNRDASTYVVYSYGTPIAWVLRNGHVRIPDVQYSKSTTDHQTLARQMLREPKVFVPIREHAERMHAAARDHSPEALESGRRTRVVWRAASQHNASGTDQAAWHATLASLKHSDYTPDEGSELWNALEPHDRAPRDRAPRATV